MLSKGAHPAETGNVCAEASSTQRQTDWDQGRDVIVSTGTQFRSQKSRFRVGRSKQRRTGTLDSQGSECSKEEKNQQIKDSPGFVLILVML